MLWWSRGTAVGLAPLEMMNLGCFEVQHLPEKSWPLGFHRKRAMLYPPYRMYGLREVRLSHQLQKFVGCTHRAWRGGLIISFWQLTGRKHSMH